MWHVMSWLVGWLYGCVPVQVLHPSKEHLTPNYVTRRLLSILLFPVFGGRTAAILRSLTYPKIVVSSCVLSVRLFQMLYPSRVWRGNICSVSCSCLYRNNKLIRSKAAAAPTLLFISLLIAETSLQTIWTVPLISLKVFNFKFTASTRSKACWESDGAGCTCTQLHLRVISYSLNL